MSNMMNTSFGQNMNFNDNHFRPLHQSKYCGGLIDNIADAPICVLNYKDRDKNLNLRYALK